MKKTFTTIFVFVSAGLVFSGYLSAVKLFTETCAFNEPCPYFLGYPACWYGFVMYLAMFIIGLVYLCKDTVFPGVRAIRLISALGIVFAGNFAVKEIVSSQATGTLGFSTCIYGLLFYIAIFILSLSIRKPKASL